MTLLLFLFALNYDNRSYVTLTSEQLPELFVGATGTWLKHQQDWYIIGSRLGEGKVQIWRWRENQIELFTETDAREGLVASNQATIFQDSIIIRGILTGKIYRHSLKDKDSSFELIGYDVEAGGDFLIIDSTVVIGKDDLRLRAIKNNEVEVITEINQKLPAKKAYHPIMQKTNLQKMRLAKNHERIIIGYTLYPKTIEINLKPNLQVREKSIAFKGYQSPPQKLPKRFNAKLEHEWTKDFDRIEELAFHKNTPYALFRRGIEGHGIWVNLDTGDIAWNNNQENIKVLAVSNHELVTGAFGENSEEQIEWRLWRTSGWPSQQ